jgi:fido (protein-threonine AMPylation protein)
MALENKLGLTSSADLAREEERISKKKAVELFENGVLDTLSAGKFSTLQSIHKYLFEDIYDFAGKLRKEDYLLAMERSPIKDMEIKVLLKSALTDEINSREVYMIGIDHSYYYEGYTTFKTEEL